MGFHFPKCSLSLLCLSPISVSWPILLTIFTNFFTDMFFSISIRKMHSEPGKVRLIKSKNVLYYLYITTTSPLPQLVL